MALKQRCHIPDVKPCPVRAKRCSPVRVYVRAGSPVRPGLPDGSRYGSRRRHRCDRRRPVLASPRRESGCSGIGSVAAATNVPFAESKSSTHQRVPSVVSWVWRRLTPESGSQSIWGWMLRLREIRPTKIDLVAQRKDHRKPGRGHRIRTLLGFVPRRIDPDFGDPVKASTQPGRQSPAAR